ncbi:MAG: rhomboid family intramembrane serine protease [Flavobacteriaceae bacterium]|nr:rhomboid family intramembrane serine protease [Flavobacteriaceae bacterium]
MGRLTDTIKHLIIINVILFAVPQFMQLNLAEYFALYFPKNENFGIWQYVTHMFMHGSFMHIAFNMYALWAFGTPLEQMWGRNKFLFFYFSAGLGAAAIYTLVNYYQFNGIYQTLIENGVTGSQITEFFSISSNTVEGFMASTESILKGSTTLKSPVNIEDVIEINRFYNSPAVGASGAVYGVLVAFGMSFPNAKLALIFFPIPVAAKYFIPLMLLGDLFFGVTNYSIGNIAHFAHIGGAIIGFIIAWSWKKNQFNRWN